MENKKEKNEVKNYFNAKYKDNSYIGNFDKFNSKDFNFEVQQEEKPKFDGKTNGVVSEGYHKVENQIENPDENKVITVLI